GRAPADRRALVAAMIAGVALIVSGSLKSGNWFGDFMALLTAFLIAAAITITRKSGKDMGLAPMIGVALPGLLALVMVAGGEGIRFEQPWWALIDGAIIMPVSMFCLAVAPRHISGPQVAMFYLLETVLTPVWVWMIFAERPDDMALAGGAIILAALAAHIGWQATARRRAMRARVPRRPA
ncbi:MAG TPA: EamA family transporter, partial [Rhizobiaceae bacterium]|nr:EamA family transporter [Rhizobiaceae bacterium]